MVTILNLLAQLRPLHLIVVGIAGSIVFSAIAAAGVLWAWRAGKTADHVTTISAKIMSEATRSPADTKTHK
ncbi:MAG: hypothetical protein HY242_02370 [Afipia sp.]|nr:hypothetical protein [Afipia sp.]